LAVSVSQGSAPACNAAFERIEKLCGTRCKGFRYTASEMDVERIIEDIQELEEMFEASDIRPLSAADISAANRSHDEALAASPWFRLWQSYGLCCRAEAPVLDSSASPAFPGSR
jgi:hypothetical protein